MLDSTEIVIRLLLAALFGALVGLERERKDWTAGMRTHMMVSVGSALIMIVSAYGFSDVLGKTHVTLDPSRIAAQVISGIGFIGAGTILFLKQGTIRGLTTASGLWTVAAIGLAAGGGMYFAAGVTTVLAIAILWAMQPLEQRFARRFKQKTLRIVTTSVASLPELLKMLEELTGVTSLNFSMDTADSEFILQLKFERMDAAQLSEVVMRLQQHVSVKEIFWNN